MLGASTLALLTGSSASTWASTTCPNSDPCVVVDVVGSVSATRTFDLTDLQSVEDIDDAVYVLRNTAGREQSQPVPWAVSVRTLLSSVPLPEGGTLDPGSVTFAEVVDDSSVSHPLSNADLGPAGANGFEDSLMPAVFIGSGGASQYVRPLRDDDSTDANVTADPTGNGWISVSPPRALHVVVHTSGTILSPTIDTPATDLRVDQSTGFSATFPHDPGTNLTYSWDFRDGDISTDATPSHAWSQSGTYYVNLTVRGDDGSFGRASAVLISVDPEPSTEASASPSGTGQSSSADAIGPTKSKGKHHGGHSSETASNGTTSSSSSSAASAGATATTSPSSSSTSSSTASASPTPSSVAGSAVKGTVLWRPGDQSAPVSGTPESPTGATAEAARARAESSFGLPGWVALPGAVVLLLGAGMLAEAPGWRRFIHRRSDGTMTR